MKKIATFALLLIPALCLQAQNMKINLVNGESVTYSAGEILSIEFNAEPEEELFHEFVGWITVSSGYFKDMYYGDQAVIKVYRKGDGYTCRFHDDTWGDGYFPITLSHGQISGEGTMSMDNHRGGVTDYEATISGPMTAITISMPTVMGGTEINWHYGAAPENYKVSGTWKGTNNVNVGGAYDYAADNVRQSITANSDGSVSLSIPEYTLTGTVMGDITLGQYAILNIPYNEEKGGFYREYADGTLSVHFKAVKDGTTTMDNDYVFNNKSTTTSVLITLTDEGVTITNTFSLGNMPFPITAVMNGVK
jgi:hypothetical protein